MCSQSRSYLVLYLIRGFTYQETERAVKGCSLN